MAGGRVLFQHQTQLFPAIATPGYDAVLDPVIHAGLAKVGSIFQMLQRRSAMGFTQRDSPYVSESDVRSQSDRGVRRGDLHALRPPRRDRRVALVRLGGRQDLQIGWVRIRIPAAQNQNVTVSSNGFTPRFMVNYDVTDRVALNAQASRGFRLGGVNDPLNEPICAAKRIMKPTAGSSGSRTRPCGTTRSGSNPHTTR